MADGWKGGGRKVGEWGRGDGGGGWGGGWVGGGVEEGLKTDNHRRCNIYSVLVKAGRITADVLFWTSAGCCMAADHVASMAMLTCSLDSREEAAYTAQVEDVGAEETH